MASGNRFASAHAAEEPHHPTIRPQPPIIGAPEAG